MTDLAPVPTLTHPTMEWKLSNDDESTLTIKAEYVFAMPHATPPPDDGDNPARHRHPYPNCVGLKIEAIHAAAKVVLSRTEAERLHEALGLALRWDGQ